MVRPDEFAALVEQGVMSPELAALLSRPRHAPRSGVWHRVEKAADRLLAKAGFFPPPDHGLISLREEFEAYELRGLWHDPAWA